MGLRGAQGHTPEPEDFDGLLTPEGNSGDVFGTDVVGSPFVYGEDGSTGGTPVTARATTLEAIIGGS